MTDLAALSKVLYGPALVLLLMVLTRRHNITVDDLIDSAAWVGAVAGTSIVVLTITGLSTATYENQGVGSKGIFISQNDIGVAMGIGLIAAMYRVVKLRRPRDVALALVACAGMLLLGTRAAMLGAFAIPAVTPVILGPRMPLTWQRAFTRALVVGLIASIITTAGLWEYRTVTSERFEQEKLQRLAENPFVRAVRVTAAFIYIRQRPVVPTLFGEGISAYGRGVADVLHIGLNRSLAEVDWVDMTGEYGLLFAILIHAFYMRFLLAARRHRQLIGQSASRTVQLAVIWFLVHSMVAGHAVAGTVPAGTLAALLVIGGGDEFPPRFSARSKVESVTHE